MKPTFLEYEKPLLCAMIQHDTPEKCIEKIKKSLEDGAEALGIQLCKLKTEYRNEKDIRRIFEACEGKPIYVTSYLSHSNETYEDCEEMLLLAASCGATLCDVMGDMYAKSPYYQLTVDEQAIEKQKALINKLHDLGAEVLMSSHVQAGLTKGECLMIAKAHIERGADIIKIVTRAESKDEVPGYLEAIREITQMTDKKLLFLSSREGQITRYIGPNFGVCMYLCVNEHEPCDTVEQPVLKRLKQIRDNIRFDI